MTQGLADFLDADTLGSLVPEADIVMLWSLQGDRVLAASPAALRFFGVFQDHELLGRRFGPALHSTVRIAELGRFLGLGEPPRVERLRFFIGIRSESITCLCSRVLLKTGDEALLVLSRENRKAVSRWVSPVATDTVTQQATVPTANTSEILAATRYAPVKNSVQTEIAALHSAFPAHLPKPDNGMSETPSSEAKTFQTGAGEKLAGVENMSRVTARFVFETDEAMQIRSISGDFTTYLHTGGQEIKGRNLLQLARESGIVDTAALAAKLSEPVTWQGVTLNWPARSGDANYPVELSGLPIRDLDRQFKGFRGFGLIRLDRKEFVAVNPVKAIPAEPDTPDAPPSASAAFAPDPVPPKIDPAERLSPSERNAFREIAKALGVHALGVQAHGEASFGAQSQDPQQAELPPVDAKSQKTEQIADADIIAWQQDNDPHMAAAFGPEPEPVRLANQPDRHLPDTLLIDRLPIGVLVMRQEQALFLNQTLLDLLDYENLTEFNGENGLSTLFAGQNLRTAEDGTFDVTGIRTRDGEVLRVATHLQSLEFDGHPATLVSFRNAGRIRAGTEPGNAQAVPEPEKPPSPPISDTPVENANTAPHLQLVASAPKASEAVHDGSNTEQDTALQQAFRDAILERDEARAILDTATDGVVSLDAEGRIIGLNRSAEALFGINQNEIAGERFTTLLASESHATAMDYLEGLKTGGVAAVLNDGRDVTGREKKGGRIPLFMTLGRISDRGTGKFCAVLRDQTAWKKAESELTESRRIAERASTMKSDFLAKISHEIRTPMNAIIGFAEVMQTEQFGPIGNDRYREYLGDIHRSGEHVISLVNDLLDLSKIEAGQANLAFTSVDLNLVAQDCVSMMQPQAAREHIILRTNLADKLPSVVADQRSIKQILLNLMSNAVKFNQPGGQVILSTTMTDEGEAVIRVRDTGMGMSEKDIEQAMQPFRQLAPSRRGGGTGLGLPLSKALVEANRATLAVKSAVNQGTLMEVIFPATRVLAE